MYGGKKLMTNERYEVKKITAHAKLYLILYQQIQVCSQLFWFSVCLIYPYTFDFGYQIVYKQVQPFDGTVVNHSKAFTVNKQEPSPHISVSSQLYKLGTLRT